MEKMTIEDAIKIHNNCDKSEYEGEIPCDTCPLRTEMVFQDLEPGFKIVAEVCVILESLEAVCSHPEQFEVKKLSD